MSDTGKRIVIIEDEKIVADLMKNILEMSGYESTIAANGEQAENVLHELAGLVDLVILDYSLPDIKGAEMLKKVRLMAPNGRVLLTSGYQFEMLEDIPAESVDGFLKKPFDIREIQEKIEKTLQ